jgi:hypothetical protein
MKEAIKTFACVGAYAAGVVVGMTVAGQTIIAIEKRSARKKLEKAVKEGQAAAADLDTLEKRAAMATTFGGNALAMMGAAVATTHRK